MKRTAAAALRMGLKFCLLPGSVYVKTRVTRSRKPDEVVKTRDRQTDRATQLFTKTTEV